MIRKCKLCGAEFEGVSRDIKCPACRKIRENPIRKFTCKVCGVEFESRATRAFYCPECRIDIAKKRDAEHKRRAAAGVTRKIGSKDICVDCGQEYIVEGGLQKRCPECQEKEHRRESLERYHEKGGNEQRKERIKNRVEVEIPCIVCGKKFKPFGPQLLCCSPKCSEIHAENLRLAWRKENIDYLHQKNREWYEKNKKKERDSE